MFNIGYVFVVSYTANESNKKCAQYMLLEFGCAVRKLIGFSGLVLEVISTKVFLSLSFGKGLWVLIFDVPLFIVHNWKGMLCTRHHFQKLVAA